MTSIETLRKMREDRAISRGEHLALLQEGFDTVERSMTAGYDAKIMLDQAAFFHEIALVQAEEHRTECYTAFENWSSYFFHGDASYLPPEEKIAADKFIAFVGLGWPIEFGESYFASWHDAHKFMPLAGTVCVYTFRSKK